MKLITFLRFTLIISLFFFATACNEQRSQKYSAGVAANTTPAISDEDIRFLFAAHNIALYNTCLANEAEIRSTAVETFTMASELVQTNKQIDEAISEIAAQYNLSLPSDITEEQKAEWKEMITQKGWKFDKKFSAIIESNLRLTHEMFTNVITASKDESVKEIAKMGLTELNKQGELILAQQEKIRERTGDTDNDLTEITKSTMAFEKTKNR